MAASLAGLAATAPRAAADSSTMNFSCADGTTDTVLTKDTKHHSVVVTCKNGSLIDYVDYQNTGVQPVAVSASCPGTEKVDPEVDTPSQPTTKITFYCANVSGGTSNPTSTRTNHMPTVQRAAATGVTCPDGTTPKNNDVQNCKNAQPLQVTNDPALKGNCANIAKCDLINNYVNPFIKFMGALVGVAVVMSIVMGGIQYGSSGGDPSKVTAAKNRIRNALVALVAFLFLLTALNFLLPGGIL